jgi:glucan phosphoethanolaminetransferase (alkaline phosphatase superfamily)
LTFLAIKIKKYDQCLLVDSNFSAAVSRHIFDWENDRKFKGRGLGARNPINLKRTNETRDFNVLVIVCESLRKQNLGPYGYSRNTTPFIDLFQLQHSDEFFVFKYPYTVSTTTMLAVPAVLTGIGPYQSPEIFYSQPIVWDYGKMLNYRTFFLSSHSMKWYRFDRFYSKEKLDHLWYMEKSGFPLFNDLGIDDSHTVHHLNTLIRQKNKKPFFGLIQLNATHYPYTIHKRFAKWKGSFVDEYDNAILYQDFVIGKIFRELKNSGKLENTVIILTSDHGESLKDHNNIGHVDSYYAETISIPLMVYIPEKIGRKLDMEALKVNLDKTVSNIDIAPTIIDLLDLRNNNSVKQIFMNYSGFSLFKPIDKYRSLIIMNNNEVARFKVGLSLIRDQYHYIYRTNIVPNREELYNIKKDPKENRNLFEAMPKRILKKLINEFDRYPACLPYKKKEEKK